MLKYRLNLILKFFLIFWSFAIILIILSCYLALKIFKYPIITEIRLPEEYKLMLETLQKVNKHYTFVNKNDFIIIKNPFYNESEKFRNINDNLRKSYLSIHVSSIITHEKKVCILNGRLHREGDRIGNIKIEKIGDYYVIFKSPTGKRVRLEVGSSYTFVE